MLSHGIGREEKKLGFETEFFVLKKSSLHHWNVPHYQRPKNVLATI